MNKIRWFPPGKLSKYQHLPIGHKLLIDKFWNLYPHEFKRAAYSVPVGMGRPSMDTSGTNLHSDWKYATSLKIDMLVDSGSSYWITEFKNICDPESIGQVLVYKELFVQTYLKYNRLILKIIGESIHPDIARIINIFNIDFIKI